MEREEELLDIDVTSTFELKIDETSNEEVNFEEEKFKQIEEETKNKNLSKEYSDWYDDEINAILAEEHWIQDVIVAENKEEENDDDEKEHQCIQHGLAMKGFINPQHLIKDRANWKTFYDFISSPYQDKKSLEVLFYSNSLVDFLWEHYLENYTIDDILCMYKKGDNSFFKELFNLKNKKKALRTYKKQYLSPLTFAKIKKAKKSKFQATSLFGNDLLSSLPLFDDVEEISSNNREELWKLLNFSNESISLMEFWKANKNTILTSDELMKNYISLIDHKSSFYLMKLQLFIDKLMEDKIYSSTKEVEEITPFEDLINEEVFNEEVQNVLKAYQILPEPHPLSNVEKNYNIQKYLETIGFMDNSVWKHLKKEYDVPKVNRVTSLIKFISWNDSFKFEVMQDIIKDTNEYNELCWCANEQKTIEELRLQAKKLLLALPLKDLVIELVGLFSNKGMYKKTHPELEPVVRLVTKCKINTKECDLKTAKRLKLNLWTLLKIYQTREPTEEEKKTIFIDEIRPNENGVYEKVPIGFTGKVKTILIELFVQSVNEHLSKFSKLDLYKKFFPIKAFGFVSGKNMFEKGKALLYLREKWEYACAVYGMSSQLFTKLKGLGTLTLNINWRGEEIIDKVQYYTLWEKTLKDFEETLISKEEIQYFKNFKKKLLLYSKILDWEDWKNFQNTLKNLDSKNTFMFFKYEIRGEEIDFFFSDGEISVKLTKDEYFTLVRKAKSTNEDKDFVNTTKIIKQEYWKNKHYSNIEMYKTKVQWIDVNGDTQKNDIYTNIRCNVWYNTEDWPVLNDYFENGVHKGLLSYYFLYYHKLFDPKTKTLKLNGKTYKGIVVFDLETIWFTGNIILSYFLYIGYNTVILKKYSHKEFGNFFEVMADGDIMYRPLSTHDPDKPFGEEIGNAFYDLEAQMRKWCKGDILISGHNTLNFDNKKIAEDISQDRAMQLKIKEAIDNNTIDVLAVLMNAGYWRLGLDFLSKINFDFGKNIKKGEKEDLMKTILTIQEIIKMPDGEAKQRAIKKHYSLIHKFIVYNKNDVLMSMGLLWQLMAYGRLATGKRLAHISPEQLTISLK